jgi:hypothetical protein
VCFIWLELSLHDCSTRKKLNETGYVAGIVEINFTVQPPSSTVSVKRNAFDKSYRGYMLLLELIFRDIIFVSERRSIERKIDAPS